MLITARQRLLPRIGAWCWRHKVSRPRHKRRLKNSAASIGDRFIAFSGDRESAPTTPKISRKAFLLSERRDLRTVRKEKGRLRSYLLTALKHFLTDEHRRAKAIKRGKGEGLIPLEELHTEEQRGMEPS